MYSSDFHEVNTPVCLLPYQEKENYQHALALSGHYPFKDNHYLTPSPIDSFCLVLTLYRQTYSMFSFTSGLFYAIFCL